MTADRLCLSRLRACARAYGLSTLCELWDHLDECDPVLAAELDDGAWVAMSCYFGRQPGSVEDLMARWGLSRRECEVALLSLSGLSRREIADELVITVSCVKFHIHNVLRKSGFPNTAAMRRSVLTSMWQH